MLDAPSSSWSRDVSTSANSCAFATSMASCAAWIAFTADRLSPDFRARAAVRIRSIVIPESMPPV
jgi:hypothetical protein